MNKIEFKLAIKALDYEKKAAGGSGKLVIEGFASTPDRDRVKDIVLPKAFEKCLSKFLEAGTMLLNHDPSQPVGKWTEGKVTDSGLYVKGFISETEKDLQTKVKEGIYSTLSIGFNTIDQEWNAALESNVIKELELLEVSVVTIPANPEARFQALLESKSADTSSADTKEVGLVEVMSAFVIDELLKSKAYNYKYIRGLVAKTLTLSEEHLDQAYVSVILNGDEDSMKIKEAMKEILSQVESEKKSSTVETSEAKEAPAAEETKSTPNLEEVLNIVKELADKVKSLEESVTEVKSLITTKSEQAEESKKAPGKEMGEDGSMSEEEMEEDDKEKKPADEKESGKKEDVVEETKSTESEEEKALQDLEAEILALENEVLELEITKN